MTAAQRIRTGAHADQWVELTEATGDARGVAVLVHGGFWRERHTASLMRPLVAMLADAGWHVANVEYRRGPAAVWPMPLDDVRAALGAVAAWRLDPDAGEAAAGRSRGPVVAIGHSVGGQLALLAARWATATAPVDAVVALAPVTDAVRAFDEQLGERAAHEYFAATPDDDPGRYLDATPIARLPIGASALVVHGADDARVPVQHTLDYLAAAWAAGDDVDAHLPARLSHLDDIDPEAPHWPGVLAWMRALSA